MNTRLLRALTAAVLAIPTLAVGSASVRVDDAHADPSSWGPTVPVCGDQADGDLTVQCYDQWAPLVDASTLQVHGDGTRTVDATFDFVFRAAANDNELVGFRVDDASGRIGTWEPGRPGYQSVALERAFTIFPSGADARSQDERLLLHSGNRIAFLIVVNGTLESLREGNASAVWSLNAMNEGGRDAFLAFRNNAGTLTQFSFEDVPAGGDDDFDDVVFTVTPSLGPALNFKPVDILVMGDSYSAGNGARAYYPPSGCYRSRGNYGERFASSVRNFGRTANVETVACSGAITDDFHRPQKSSVNPQKRHVLPHHDLIFLSIGGNDVRFADIVAQCLVGATDNGKRCNELLSAAESALWADVNRDDVGYSLQEKIEIVLQEIRVRARGAKIVLVGYPYLERDPNYSLSYYTGFGYKITVRAGERIRNLGDRGDVVSQAAVDEINRRYPTAPAILFVSTKRTFAGHEMRAAGLPPAGRWMLAPLEESPATSYHPNPEGWLQMARMLLRNPRIPQFDLDGS